jgi:hypothetical protein
MGAPHADQLLEGYLARLRDAAANLPPSKREELLNDVRTHITEARLREPHETDATILNILDRLGEPEAVVAEAGDRHDGPNGISASVSSGPHQPRLSELAVPGLLILLWPIGVILLWYSTAWDARDKLIGTLLTLGGYPWVFGLALPLSHGPLVARLLSFVLMLLPVFTGGYMSYRLRWGKTARTVERATA